MGVQINGSEGNVIATKGTFSGDVGIGGTLTYEDVTNIDSVGLITARNGIEIGARPGVAASISVDGNMIVSGISTFGGDVQVPDKIIHSGDTNTAIRFPAADTITAETGGSERLRINSSGYVGIGTNNPQRPFVISNSGAAGVEFNIPDGNGGLSFNLYNRVTTGYDPLTFNANYFVFSPNATEKFRIDSSGRIGINTASPSRTFEISGGASSIYNFSINGGNSTTGMKMGNYTASAGYNKLSIEASDILFYTGTAGGTSATQRMSIEANGDITVNFDGSSQTGQFNIADGSESSPGLTFWADGGGDTGIFRSGANTLNFSTGGTERLRIDSSGNTKITGYLKSTSDGNIVQTGTYHESYQTYNNQHTHWFHHAGSNSAQQYGIRIKSADDGNDVVNHIQCSSGGATSFVVRRNGSVESRNNSYGGVSDIKLKENIVDANSQWDDIKNIKVRNFNFKDNPTKKMLGVVAQEIELVSTGLVEDIPDLDDTNADLGTVTKVVKSSILYMKAIKALQEAQTRIETLESRLDTAGL